MSIGRWWWAIAATGLAAAVAFLAVPRSGGSAGPQSTLEFGAFTVADGQIPRINVVNAAPAVGGRLGAGDGGCVLELSFLNGDGENIAQTRSMVAPQRVEAYELGKDAWERAIGKGNAREGSVTLRGRVEVLPGGPAGEACVPVATLEVIDDETRRASSLLPATQRLR